MSRLTVNEIYLAKQGEGKSAGEWCVFLRLTACNLSCFWCDTPYTWNWIGTKFKHPDKYDKKSETHQMISDDIVSQLEGIRQTAIIKDGIDFRRVVITGGEPMLQQKALIDLLQKLKHRGWFVEIETNGTITPLLDVFELVDQFNCSPKLANSGDPEDKRITPALSILARSSKVNFKFVVGAADDMKEINDLVTIFDMRDVRLMPMARTKQEIDKIRPLVIDWAALHGYTYSPRLHVEEHGDTRGV